MQQGIKRLKEIKRLSNLMGNNHKTRETLKQIIYVGLTNTTDPNLTKRMYFDTNTQHHVQSN